MSHVSGRAGDFENPGAVSVLNTEQSTVMLCCCCLTTHIFGELQQHCDIFHRRRRLKKQDKRENIVNMLHRIQNARGTIACHLYLFKVGFPGFHGR